MPEGVLRHVLFTNVGLRSVGEEAVFENLRRNQGGKFLVYTLKNL